MVRRLISVVMSAVLLVSCAPKQPERAEQAQADETTRVTIRTLDPQTGVRGRGVADVLVPETPGNSGPGRVLGLAWSDQTACAPDVSDPEDECRPPSSAFVQQSFIAANLVAQHPITIVPAHVVLYDTDHASRGDVVYFYRSVRYLRQPDGTEQQIEPEQWPEDDALESVFITLEPTPFVDSHRWVGTSLGLAATLMWLDWLEPGSLFAGRTVAATGTLVIDGGVGDIQQVFLKASAAATADADVMFVPNDSGWARLAVRQQDSDMAIFRVDHVEDAVRWLCRRGATTERLCAIVGSPITDQD